MVLELINGDIPKFDPESAARNGQLLVGGNLWSKLGTHSLPSESLF